MRWPRLSARERRTRTRAWSSAGPRSWAPATSASSASTTPRPRESACACWSDGAWGFACDRRLRPTARQPRRQGLRVRQGRAGRPPARLAPVEPRAGAFRTKVERDPFEVSLADKVELCLRAERALAHDDVKVTSASVRAQREHKVFVSSEGAAVEHELVECGGGIDALAARDGVTQIRSYPSAHGGSSAQAGWEYVESLGLEREAPRVASRRPRCCTRRRARRS
jgi:TldD protein